MGRAGSSEGGREGEQTFDSSVRPGRENLGMDRAQLAAWIEEGLSLSEIGRRVCRDPSTVGYWVTKHGLVASGRDKHAPRGGIVDEVLEIMCEDGLTLQEMADQLGRSVSTIRYWLGVYGLTTRRPWGRRSRNGAKRRVITEVCRHHGHTEFVLEGRGAYRCRRCRQAAVSRWRRRLKAKLVREAGGSCRLGGYDRYQGALQFHHLDPPAKRFLISRKGATRSRAEARREAAKCLLLCANCHAEVEAGLVDLKRAA